QVVIIPGEDEVIKGVGGGMRYGWDIEGQNRVFNLGLGILGEDRPDPNENNKEEPVLGIYLIFSVSI
ncbi:MAG: hypothetical protein O7E56_15590, partial [SAR324 cluster bacterium]|nr:hypothetical protein [SAR324 cluster bacterium]